MKIRLLNIKGIGWVVSLLMGGVCAASGATLNVGPGYYSTIASAVSAASDNDTIVILVSTQTECGVSIINKSLTIQGLGATNTIVQGASTRSNAASRIFLVNGAAKAVRFRDMTIRYGYATNNDDYGYGGGAIYNSAGTVTVENCTLTMNDSLLTGAHAFGGGALAQYTDSKYVLTLINSVIASNTVAGTLKNPAGGGVYMGHGSLWVEGCTFVGNSAGGNGGAINGASFLSMTIRNSTLISNSAGSDGGALYFPSTSGLTGTIYNCTICSNSALYGQSLRVTGANLLVYSSILSGSGASILYTLNNATILSNSLIKGTVNGTYMGGGNITGQDPLLLPLSYNGGSVPTMALQSGSPCTNTGSNILSLPYDQRGAGFGRTRGLATDMGAFEYGSGVALAYSGNTFAEKMPQNTGGIDNTTPLLITLSVDTFTGADGSELTNNVVVSNLPAGLAVSMVRSNNGTMAVVTLVGNAVVHASGNTIHDFGIAFQDGAFSLGYASQVANASRSDLTVTFSDPVSSAEISYSSTVFAEDSIYNDGRVNNASPMLITISNEFFAGTDGSEITNNVVVSNLPTGLTVSMIRTNAGTNVMVRLLGQTAPHAAAQTVSTLGFTFLDGAFQGGSAAVVTGAMRSDLGITFLDPATGVALLYNGSAFTEDPVFNDGRLVATTIGLTLTNDVLNGENGDNFVAANRVLVSNLPAGLTAAVTRVDYKHLNLTLSGKALAHNSVSNVNTLTFSFQDSAFYNTAAASVSNATKSDLTIAFSNPTLTYANSTFTEYWKNDGTIGNAITLTLVGDTFTGLNNDNFAGLKALVGNVPGGLAASMIRQSVTQLVFQLTGVATAHTTADTIANLSLALADSAFSQGGAAAVTNSIRSNLGVQYVGSSAPSNFWVSSTSGSDTTGTGSLASPWATIKFAVNNAAVRNNAYDTINVLAGTYNETNITVNKSLLIQGAGRDATIVQAGAQYATAPFDSRVFILSASCTLRDMTLRHGNVTNQAQGAAVNCTATEVVMDRCRVTRNNCHGVYAYNGGSVANLAGLLTMRDCEITDNTARIGGVAGVLSWTGASVSISNCLFSGNQSMHQGGGLYANSVLVTIQDSTFLSNSVALSALHGGGFASELPTGTTIVERCTVIDNQSPNAGGGMYLRGSSLTLTHCTIFGNIAGTNGGGLYIYDGAPRLYQCTIASNRVTAGNGAGGGLYNAYGINSLYSSIIAGNSAAGTGPDIAGGPTLDDHSLIGNNANSGMSAGQPNVNGSYLGTAGMPIDPQLLAPANNGGGTWTCRLLEGSLAIDHGSNPLGLALDQRGLARQNGSTVDIGAFEFVPDQGSVMKIR